MEILCTMLPSGGYTHAKITLHAAYTPDISRQVYIAHIEVYPWGTWVRALH